MSYVNNTKPSGSYGFDTKPSAGSYSNDLKPSLTNTDYTWATIATTWATETLTWATAFYGGANYVNDIKP